MFYEYMPYPAFFGTIRLFLGQGLAFYGEDRLADLRRNVHT